ncbi:MAG: peroxiredoxin family protein [Planctomycetaceae bacterium]
MADETVTRTAGTTVSAAPTARRTNRPRQLLVGALAAVVCLGAAWNLWRQFHTPDPYAADLSKPFPFLDEAESNVMLDAVGTDGLAFTTVDGQPFSLDGYAGRTNIVLVVTRGNTSGQPPGVYAGRICLYCASQISRLIANYDAIRALGAEVVVVFPVDQGDDRGAVDALHRAVRADSLKFDGLRVDEAPFPVVLDVGRKMVDQLGIRGDLARPATYILDTRGRLRFAYLSQSLADRPSVRCILGKLEAIAAAPAGVP